MSKPLPVFQPLSPPGAAHLVEVAFKGNRRGFYTTSDESVRQDDHVIVEAERGLDLGRVRSVGGVAKSKCSAAGDDGSTRIVRRAEPEEVRQSIVLRTDEDRVRRQSRELVERHKLKMKVTEAEWQWDRNKLTIYFTAERRVDFRELVRELARTFRTRIELKQIGVRDEAALLGGMGRCGRQLCCATWLREIRPVSLQLAKDQNLSLNPSQISGTCGRLMCCLTYEHDSYLQARKRFPREGKILQTARGAEKVIGIDIWRDSVLLLDENRQRRTATLAELRQETGAATPTRRDQPDTPAAEGDGGAGRTDGGGPGPADGGGGATRDSAAVRRPDEPRPDGGPSERERSRRQRPARRSGGGRPPAGIEATNQTGRTAATDAPAAAAAPPPRAGADAATAETQAAADGAAQRNGQAERGGAQQKRKSSRRRRGRRGGGPRNG